MIALAAFICRKPTTWVDVVSLHKPDVFGNAGQNCWHDNFGPNSYYMYIFVFFQVREINKILNSLSLRTWFDEERIVGNIKVEMTKGIDDSRWVVVFITKRYIDKIESGSMEVQCLMIFPDRPYQMLCACRLPYSANTARSCCNRINAGASEWCWL